MFRKLIPAFRAAGKQRDHHLLPGERVYAIGDIHGRHDLLEMLLDQIAADDQARGGKPATLIFLGDLIDRGPGSAQVVERLLRMDAAGPGMRFLLGNHEEVFLLALRGDVNALKFFNRIGGRETILSYGITELEYLECDYPELLQLLQKRVPEEHIAFLERFEDMIILGDYAFVHAGVRPGTPLAQQKISDLRWIREEFIGHRGELEKMIIHGHTISDEVEQTGHRIGLDTGAYASGKLTAMGFEGADRWTLQARIDTFV